MTNVNLSRMEQFLYRGNYFPYGTEPAPASGWAEAFTAEEIRNAQTYDHVDEITRTGLIHNHNVAINAGSEKFRLYASFNYYDQNSILKVSDMKRFSGRLNFEANFNKNVKLSVASMYSHCRQTIRRREMRAPIRMPMRRCRPTLPFTSRRTCRYTMKTEIRPLPSLR